MPSQLKHRHKYLSIYRHTKRKKFLYLNSGGGIIKDNGTLERISNLRIPPGYNDVKISSNSNNHLQATGVDSKGRIQYIYTSEHIEKSHKIKFKELINFGKKINKIKKDVMVKIKDDDNIYSKSKIIGLVTYLLDQCLFRIGNKFYAKQYNTYGITTLKQQHFNCKQGIIYIQFVGKKSVVNHCHVNNKHVISILKKLIKNAGRNDNVFRYLNNQGKYNDISSNDINNYLKGYSPKLTVKMFRTWEANNIFLNETLKDLRKNPELETDVTDSYAKKHVIKTLKIIAEKLHNTPTVSKTSYMNNEILNMYLEHPTMFYKKIKLNQPKDISKLLVQILETY
jgi:DNA topoisomerase-1